MKPLLINSLCVLLLCATVQAGSAFNVGYAEVLSEYVDHASMVNYSGLSNDRKNLDTFIQSLEKIPPEVSNGWKEADWIAFWINAYNARTLQVIIDHYPVSKRRKLLYPKNSIRQIPGAWDKLTFPILGKDRTLHEIEHEILRKQFNESRIHMALVCAAKGCPKLRNEPYSGESLDEQLADQARDFFTRPDRFQIDGKYARISPILKWFKDDFRSVPAFIQKYSGQDIAGLKIKYLPYDWALNEQ